MTPQQVQQVPEGRNRISLSLSRSCCCCPIGAQPSRELRASFSLRETLLLSFQHATSQSLLQPPDLRYFRHREPNITTDPLVLRILFPQYQQSFHLLANKLEKWDVLCCLELKQALWKVIFLFSSFR
jgi:hypothetical protein